MKPLCFVIMPFGKKKDTDGKTIDFDSIYKDLIHPSIEKAGMEPIRADEETVNGIIHKPMYERLILCDYAIADLTTSNANVLYELGIRHAVKPFTTINIYASGSKLPFDVNGVRCMPYTFDSKKGLTKLDSDIESLTKKLKNAKKKKDTDSPVYQLVDGISFQNSVAHQKTDIFRDQVMYNEQLKKRLARIRAKNVKKTTIIEEIDKIVFAEIDVDDAEAGVLVDIMLSYRALNAFDKMIDFIRSMPSHVQNTVMIQEQLGFALNRVGEKDEAIEVLENVLRQHGPSSETYGILGRVYKDQFDAAHKEGSEIKAAGYLDKAIETYKMGFEADWRDAYPGVNLLSLLAIKGEEDQVSSLAPVVTYSVERKIQSKGSDYWDYATLLEISVIANDEVKAEQNLKRALTSQIEGSWMLKSTIDTIQRLASIKLSRSENASLTTKILSALHKEFEKINH